MRTKNYSTPHSRCGVVIKECLVLKFYLLIYLFNGCRLTLFVNVGKRRLYVSGFCAFFQANHKGVGVCFMRLDSEVKVLHCSYIPVVQTQIAFFVIRQMKVINSVYFIPGKYHFAVLIFNGHIQDRLGYVYSTMRYEVSCGVCNVYIYDYCRHHPVLQVI